MLSLESSTDGDAKAKFKRYSVHAYVCTYSGCGWDGESVLCRCVGGASVMCGVRWWAGCLLAHGSPLCTVAHSEEV